MSGSDDVKTPIVPDLKQADADPKINGAPINGADDGSDKGETEHAPRVDD